MWHTFLSYRCCCGIVTGCGVAWRQCRLLWRLAAAVKKNKKTRKITKVVPFLISSSEICAVNLYENEEKNDKTEAEAAAATVAANDTSSVVSWCRLNLLKIFIISCSLFSYRSLVSSSPPQRLMFMLMFVYFSWMVLLSISLPLTPPHRCRKNTNTNPEKIFVFLSNWKAFELRLFVQCKLFVIHHHASAAFCQPQPHFFFTVQQSPKYYPIKRIFYYTECFNTNGQKINIIT